MDKRKVFLLVQSILCVVLALLLIAGVIAMYVQGSAAKADDPLARIFTRELVAQRLRPIAPLFFAALGVTALGLLLGVKDENGLSPVKGGRVESRAHGGKTLRTLLLLLAALGLLAAGVFNGSAQDVFGKAVKICTECVGLG